MIRYDIAHRPRRRAPRHTAAMDAALDRGYDPHPDDNATRVPGPELSPDWAAALAASVAEVATGNATSR